MKLVVDERACESVVKSNRAKMSHEYIYEGKSQIGVRLCGVTDELYPLLCTSDNNPVSQMEIRLKAVAMGADTPGVWDWTSVGMVDDDVYIYWEAPATTSIQDARDDSVAESQSRLM